MSSSINYFYFQGDVFAGGQVMNTMPVMGKRNQKDKEKAGEAIGFFFFLTLQALNFYMNMCEKKKLKM